MGTQLQSGLRIGQLQQLGRGAAAYSKGDADPSALLPADLLRGAGEIKNPAVLLAVGKAAAACNIVL